jgi:hypothetical protein
MSASPAPSMIVVSSLLIWMLLGGAELVQGGLLQRQADFLGDHLVPPVRIAMSCSMALRRSPKPGAFTARP